MTLGYSKTFPWGGETHFPDKILSGEKLHTIRADKTGRWIAGRPIHHVTGNRTPNRQQFMENNCTAVEPVTMVFDERGKISTVQVSGENISGWETIAKNDGLSIIDFERWFFSQAEDGIYKGSIIHWTNIRYGRA